MTLWERLKAISLLTQLLINKIILNLKFNSKKLTYSTLKNWLVKNPNLKRDPKANKNSKLSVYYEKKREDNTFWTFRMFLSLNVIDWYLHSIYLNLLL